ncbi:MAG: CPCC family cysteine-rich protein [Terracidiphilus sp.]
MGIAAIRFRCPCCGYRTLEAPNTLGLCPVCWWEDDGQEDVDASDVRNTVNGELSLNAARLHYSQCGAAHPRFLPYVRKPEVSEQ